MLFNDYERGQLLFNINLKEACSEEKLEAYRGELILVEGEVADASGRRAPPAKLLRQTIGLADDTQLRFLAGIVDEVADIGILLAKYGPQLYIGSLCVLFAVDLAKPLTVATERCTLHLMPLDEGLAWTELMDLAALEKGDIKHLSSADKVLAVYRELIGFRPRGGTEVSLEQAFALSTGRQRVMRGPV